MAKFSDNGGKVLQVVQVQLVYWGSAWTSTTSPANPSSAAITAAVRTMLRSAYMTGLSDTAASAAAFCGAPPSSPRAIRPTASPTRRSGTSSTTRSRPARCPPRTSTARRCTSW